MLIVLEGLDGAGKSTQVKLLREYLETVCPRLEYIHFPRYDAPVYGNLIGKYLRGGFGPMSSVHPQLVALLFAEDRRAAADSMRKAMDEGATVLLDRYVYSNMAYQCAKLESDEEAEELREWIIGTEYGDFGIPRPDLNIFLDVPINFIERSLAAGRQGDDREYLHGQQDIHEADIAFQKRVREMYLREAGRDSGLVVIGCGDEDGRMMDPEAIFNKIRTVYENHKKD